MGVAFYGDYLCPYCFVENERLTKLGAQDRVEFRPVVLVPDAPVPWDPEFALFKKIMDDGWERFVERAPDMGFVRPESLPNTRLAATATAEARRIAPELEPALRKALFEGLWLHGKDLGVTEVLMEIWREVGLPERERFSRDARAEARVWTTTWSNGPFDRRTPVLADDHDRRLLGLADEDAILAFLDDPSAGAHLAEVCRTAG